MAEVVETRTVGSMSKLQRIKNARKLKPKKIFVLGLIVGNLLQELQATSFLVGIEDIGNSTDFECAVNNYYN